MKFICEQCQSKYNISDQRVRGKTLKIKCKRCGHIMVVGAVEKDHSSRLDQGKQGEGQGSVLEQRFAQTFRKKGEGRGNAPVKAGLYHAVKRSAEGMEQGQENVSMWFVAMDNKPVGPVSAKRVFQYQKNGRVNDGTLVWKDGMVDWDELRNVRDLVGLLASLELEESLKADAATPSFERGVFAGGGAEQPSALLGKEVGQAGAYSKADAPVDAEKATDAEKAIDAVGKTDSSSFDPEEFSKVTSIFPVSPQGADRSWKVMAAVGFFVVSILVFVVVLLFGEDTPETIIKEKIVEKTEIVYRDRPIDALQKEDKPQGGDASKQSDNIDRDTKTSGKRTPVVRKTPSAAAPRQETAEEKKKRLLGEMLSAAPSVGGVELKGHSAEAEAVRPGEGLTQKQMSQVVSRNRSSLQLCYERAMKTGAAPTDRDLKVVFDVRVGTSGMVSDVRLSGTGASYTNLSNCLKSTATKWMFPSAGSSSRVQFPILFTPAK